MFLKKVKLLEHLCLLLRHTCLLMNLLVSLCFLSKLILVIINFCNLYDRYKIFFLLQNKLSLYCYFTDSYLIQYNHITFKLQRLKELMYLYPLFASFTLYR